MKTNLPVELNRDLVVSVLAQYTQQANPSAMTNLIRDALRLAAASMPVHDKAWAEYVADDFAGRAHALRTLETQLYLGPECTECMHPNHHFVSLAEWIAAAGVDWSTLGVSSRLSLIRAWEQGADSTEYAAQKAG